ncbi:putative tRNA (uracil-O(2)-)-methyltransferase [Nymphon striatum]|nr:putative tRNA (uracil-O(2)-)-methyltransferase [Nymphon striatum]
MWNEITFENDSENEDLLSCISESCFVMVLQELIPKNETLKKCQQIVILATPEILISPDFIYKIERCEYRLLLKVIDEKEFNSSSCQWLGEFVLPKIAAWSGQIKNQNSILSVNSLSLLNVEKYNHVYQQMKLKYGKKLTEMWPESTDPQKYVYEDIAIAAYLVVLWESEIAEQKLPKKQSFVDLGCGNGLLVYLLMCEGYEGIGIDVRCRKVWNLYDPKPCLKEISIIPSDEYLFPEYDWLIGNHSDELTPWIPVIASRSSFKMRYFLLPCCFYDFSGKFQRTDSSKTQYHSYLDYIHSVGKISGFNPKIDKMRIPSTKRICFIGQSRSYLSAESSVIEHDIRSLIHNSKSQVEVTDDKFENQWATEFIPREKIEKTRNCTKVDSAIVNNITNKVFSALLELNSKDSMWNEGVRKGKVCIKKPKSVEHSTNKNLKTKLCWFHQNHPNGCPLPPQCCSFAHGKSYLVS